MTGLPFWPRKHADEMLTNYLTRDLLAEKIADAMPATSAITIGKVKFCIPTPSACSPRWYDALTMRRPRQPFVARYPR